MTQVERKDQIVTWNGDPQFWLEYVKRVRLQYERTEYRKRGLLGAELASRLTGRAWDIASAELDHNQLQKPDGAAYLLRFLEQRLCKAPIPDTGQRLEEFFMKIRRVPGSSMAEWSAQLREAYRRLQRAMARQRKDQADREPTKAIQSSKLSTPTPRRRSDVTSPGRGRTLFTPTGSEAPAQAEEHQSEPADPGHPNAEREGYEELPTSETASNPGHNHAQGQWSAEEWAEWYANRQS